MDLKVLLKFKIENYLSTIGYQKKFEEFINTHGWILDTENKCIKIKDQDGKFGIFEFLDNKIQFETREYFIKYDLLLDDLNIKFKKEEKQSVHALSFSLVYESLKEINNMFNNYIEAKKINKLSGDSFIEQQISFFNKIEFTNNYEKSRDYFILLKSLSKISSKVILKEIIENHEFNVNSIGELLHVTLSSKFDNIKINASETLNFKINQVPINTTQLCPSMIDFLSLENGLFGKIKKSIEQLDQLVKGITEMILIKALMLQENSIRIKKVTQHEVDLLSLISDYDFPITKKILDNKNNTIKQKI